MSVERQMILGTPVDSYTYESWLAQMGEWIEFGDRVYHVCTSNPEFVMIAQQNPAFFEVLNEADAVLADGVGLVLASRWRGHPLPGRVTGSDGIFRLAERAAEKGWRLFFLGAAPGVARQAAEKLRARYEQLQVVGVSGVDPDKASDSIQQIAASGTDVLLVAYGAPVQDLWIAEHREQLPVKVALGVGGAFDFVAGVVPRAPRWMQHLGIEWLFRLYKQPWRWRRMLRLPLFVLMVLRYGSRPTPRARRVVDG
jgi:N-acetylglucosaminyldiphosphoundecaprenol N-acetyl-beta-D-mannosaminyltransferase